MEKNKLKFEQTCGSCPEQYNIYSEDKLVAYVRLRWGFLSVEMPDVNGEQVYSHNFRSEWMGNFRNQIEREEYIKIIEEIILKKLEKNGI